MDMWDSLSFLNDTDMARKYPMHAGERDLICRRELARRIGAGIGPREMNINAGDELNDTNFQTWNETMWDGCQVWA